MNCGSCRYFDAQPVIGLCKRYPQHHNKQPHDWCGEFAQQAPAPVDLTPTPSEPPKRRGRPPKAK